MRVLPGWLGFAFALQLVSDFFINFIFNSLFKLFGHFWELCAERWNQVLTIHFPAVFEVRGSITNIHNNKEVAVSSFLPNRH